MYPSIFHGVSAENEATVSTHYIPCGFYLTKQLILAEGLFVILITIYVLL